ncbi:MAG: hypothetical protein COU07_02600 [Candidatus Harrisonbacteria bacterium CG10_big_fil_rev_8_21_14_0_10_40_38]|uniref:Lipoprotein n=1 Tax=Candidatus Harrisonbacteria bacterium CG10_big_fil_rev_8_21_14_0_10_40_38 TaxID=1974583 RepID=A0A2H0UTJ3_9BACT|nr:MAG: hypothetical protein COU07_02600 [Candidatus Harrisonbacteria bacterium CG10_big_fil_rev_8_21_14_0_10_40_38]
MEKAYFALIAVFSVCSCTVTDHERKFPKSCEGDLDAIKDRFSLVKNGETTEEDLRALGFVFEDDNIRTIPGPGAMKTLFSNEAFQGLLGGLGKAINSDLWGEYSSLRLIIIPHKDITTTEDIIYINHKLSTRIGHNFRFILVFKDDVVIYHDSDGTFFDESRDKSAFLLGLWTLLGITRDNFEWPPIPKLFEAAPLPQ